MDDLADPPRDKAKRKERYGERALRDLRAWADANGIAASAKSADSTSPAS